MSLLNKRSFDEINDNVNDNINNNIDDELTLLSEKITNNDDTITIIHFNKLYNEINNHNECNEHKDKIFDLFDVFVNEKNNVYIDTFINGFINNINHSFLNEWFEYIQNKFGNEKISQMLNVILIKIRRKKRLSTKIRIFEKIWSYDCFKKLFNEYDKFLININDINDNNNLIEGIFYPFDDIFDSENTNEETLNDINTDNIYHLSLQIRVLLEDVKIHNLLLDYINKLIRINNNQSKTTFNNNKTYNFMRFIMLILDYMINIYGDDNIINSIKQDKEYKLNNYTVNESLSNEYKLYINWFYLISKFHTNMMYIYIKKKNMHSNLHTFFNSSLSNIRTNELNTKLQENFLSYSMDNIIIHQRFISYKEIADKFKNDNIVLDYVLYTTYIYDIINKNEYFYDNINYEIFNTLIDIIYYDNFVDVITNLTRIDCCNLLLKILLSKNEIFIKYSDNINSDLIFDTILKYLTEVNIGNIISFNEELIHYDLIINWITRYMQTYPNINDIINHIQKGLYKTITNCDNIIMHLFTVRGFDKQQTINYIVRFVNFINKIYDYGLNNNVDMYLINYKYMTFINKFINKITQDAIRYNFSKKQYIILMNSIYIRIYKNYDYYSENYPLFDEIKNVLLENIAFSCLNRTDSINIYKLLIQDDEQINTNNNLYDPLLDIKIIRPVMIPNNDEIFDELSILTHIYEKNENPYTREKLTDKEFYEYQNKQEVINHIKQYFS